MSFPKLFLQIADPLFILASQCLCPFPPNRGIICPLCGGCPDGGIRVGSLVWIIPSGWKRKRVKVDVVQKGTVEDGKVGQDLLGLEGDLFVNGLYHALQRRLALHEWNQYWGMVVRVLTKSIPSSDTAVGGAIADWAQSMCRCVWMLLLCFCFQIRSQQGGEWGACTQD